MSQGNRHLQGTRLRLFEAGISARPHPAQPTAVRARAAISDMAEHSLAVPCIDMGEAGHALHTVPQGPAAVRCVQGQYLLPA
jgi:hypothetical protein